MKTNDGRLIVIGGASRSGKTAYVRKATAKDRRIFAWDVEGQWAELPGWVKVTTREALMAAAHSAAAQRVAYVAGGDLAEEFNFWSACVQYAGRYVAPLVAIAEELADVSSQAKAPAKWGILLRRGLKRGITIYAISQRWQEADKTAVGNASEFVFFRQNGPEAARYLSRKTGIPETEIPSVPLEFVKFDPTNGNILHSKLRF